MHTSLLATLRARPWAAATAAATATGAAWYLSAPYRRPDPSPTAYGPVTVLKNDPTGSTTRTLTLGLPSSLARRVAACPVPFHFDVKNADLIVARSYTPVGIDRASEAGSATAQVLVKRYPVGETSKWMHRRQPGDEIELCGPLHDWVLPSPSDAGFAASSEPATLGMIAGGSGVTPFLQILEAALESPASPATAAAQAWPKFSLLYLATDHDAMLGRDRLDALAAAHPDRLRVTYLVPGRRQLSGDVLRESMPAPGRGLVAVCGPDGMIRTIAGDRGREYGTQGPLRGMLRELGYSASEVHKMT
ncbi:mitochondrial peripheral inner membrane protein [Blastocladiella emersonii ATCC 22665]|nr:mitochondrial peripheral inner membrane protein [Blastocladiella emersonii ATCC 22665]KAI9152426.1 mitochondrial peripheral inner membrane protein [Blastocladiella emersonii ATCC 22665]